MSVTITINSIPIEFPSDGESPDYAPAIIQFAQAVEEALQISVNPFDVAPQSFTLDSFNGSTNVNIPALAFPVSAVRAVFIRYSVYRTTSTANADEAGDLVAIYNPNNSAGLKWSISRGNMTGQGGGISFNITDSGQVQFSTTTLSGTSHTGKLDFDARAFAI